MKRIARVMGLALLMLGLLFSASPPIGDAHWHQWRGPSNTGMAVTDAPLHWSDTENIRWRAEIPGRGHSTPVVWGDRIFVTTAVPTAPIPEAAGGGPGGGPPPAVQARVRELTGGKEVSELSEDERREVFQKIRQEFGGPGGPGARGPGGPGGPGGRPGRGPGGGTAAGVEHRFLVMAFDRNTGKKLWERAAVTAKPPEGYHRQYGSFASNSPVTDGERLFAFFGSRGLFAYDLDGNLLWKKDFGVQMQMRLAFGEGVAPALGGETLVLLFDHEGDSFITALDKKTGKERWRASRDEISNWAQPLVTEYNGRWQAIVSAPNRVRSYDLLTGEVIWECGGLGQNTIPAVVREGDVVYAMSGWREPNLLAIKLGGEGDLTGSDHVLWTHQRGNPYTASPVIHDGILYLLTDRGMLSALNAKTGEPYYLQQRLPKTYSFKASPVGAGGKLYVASEEGDVVVVKMGPSYEVLATNTIKDEFFIASPVIVEGEIFLRGKNTLYCVSGKK